MSDTTIVPNGGSWTNPTNQSWVAVGSSSRTKVPLYKDKIRKGLSASSPYSRDVLKVISADKFSLGWRENRWALRLNAAGLPYYLNDTSTNYTRSGFHFHLPNDGNLGTNLGHVVSTPTDFENRAISNLHKTIRDAELNGYALLGELRETIGMLRKPFAAAREGTSKFLYTYHIQVSRAKKRYKHAKSNADLERTRRQAVVDSTSGSWLELQFGLQPLIADVKAIVGTIQKEVNRLQLNRRFQGTSPLHWGGVAEKYSDSSPIAYNLIMRVSKTRLTQASTRYVAIYRPNIRGSVDYLDRVKTSLGFDLENFVPALYELAPWSFLIDYFVNLGSMIECATTSTDGLVTCTKTTRQQTRKIIYEYAYLYPRAVSDGIWTGSSLVGKTHASRDLLRTTVVRTVLQTLPVPTLTYSVPGWGSLKWANMAALIAQTAKRPFL